MSIIEDKQFHQYSSTMEEAYYFCFQVQGQMLKLQAAIKYGEEDLVGAKSLVDQSPADDPDCDINRGCLLYKGPSINYVIFLHPPPCHSPNHATYISVLSSRLGQPHPSPLACVTSFMDGP